MISKLRPEITIARTDRGGLTPLFKSAARLRRAFAGAGPSGDRTKAPWPDVGLVGKRCQASALQRADDVTCVECGGLTPLFKSAADSCGTSIQRRLFHHESKAPWPDVGLVGKRCQASALQGAMRASQGRRLVYHFP